MMGRPRKEAYPIGAQLGDVIGEPGTIPRAFSAFCQKCPWGCGVPNEPERSDMFNGLAERLTSG